MELISSNVLLDQDWKKIMDNDSLVRIRINRGQKSDKNLVIVGSVNGKMKFWWCVDVSVLLRWHWHSLPAGRIHGWVRIMAVLRDN